MRSRVRAIRVRISDCSRCPSRLAARCEVSLFTYQYFLQPQRQLYPPYSIEGALTPGVLSQYFRSFLIRLSLLENQLGLLSATGSC